MSGIKNNLYPPIIPTYQTPFTYGDRYCKIYFSMPSYNNIEDISKEVQITISTQNDNRSALAYSSKILFSNYEEDFTVKGDNKYFIKIYDNDMNEGFQPEIYYKVQIRLTSNNVSPYDEGTFYALEAPGTIEKNDNYSKSLNWINKNLDNFSEWSTISLIKCLYVPDFSLKPFLKNDVGKKIIFGTGFQILSGTLVFKEKKDNSSIKNTSDVIKTSSEFLKSYRIYITKKETDAKGQTKDVVYIDSGEQYPINKNEVFYNIEKKLEDREEYSLSIELYTNNGYVLKQENYNFSIFKTAEKEIDVEATFKPDYINGRVKITVTMNEFSFVNNFIIKRASSKDNFLIWKDVHYLSFYNEEDLKYEWYDYTLESGVLYKYIIQRIDLRNNTRSREKIVSNEEEENGSTIVMLPLEDIFLSREGLQFKIKFDPSISSFKTNYLENKTETLGSQYPYIRRNGKVKYKEFPIAGLITAFCDEEKLFFNEDNLYTEEENLYYNSEVTGYNIKNRITKYNDFVYEKLFRDKIMNFLQEDTVKLYRSQTEGNILIKLMNINFTPNQSLGRMLYSFSATAVEVADCTVENYDKYKIQTLKKENLKNETVKHIYKIGQLNEDFLSSTPLFIPLVDVVGSLNDKYSKIYSKEDYRVNIKSFKWIRIIFDSKPSIIDNSFLGYFIYVNGKKIRISSKGIYELKDDNTNITSLIIPRDVQFTLDYIADIEISDKTEAASFRRRVLTNSVGQIYDKFEIKEPFINKIRYKYIVNYPNHFIQNFSLLNDITIEADSGTVINIIQKEDSEEMLKYEIGKTNILKFKDEYEEGIFLDFSFEGVRLYKKKYEDLNLFFEVSSIDGKNRKTILYNEYNNEKGDYPYILKIKDAFGNTPYIAEDNFLDLSEVEVDDLSFIRTMIKNCLFTVKSKQKIYYKNNWYDFNLEGEKNTGIVSCPVNALVDYTYSLIREEY